MDSKYLIVDKTILPNYYDKVIEARKLIEEGRVKDISEAVRQVGISRSTYYKYKNYVLELNTDATKKRAIISMMLVHKTGILSSIIKLITEHGYSIWTINQNPPINSQANVVIAIDLNDGKKSIDDMMREMREMNGVLKLHLIGIE